MMNKKTYFKGILEDLALADEYFAKSKQAFSGDPFYQGDPKKWRKATNVLRLKVLMSLSKRADDTQELQIKETFSKVVSENNLFKSMKITYRSSTLTKMVKKIPIT